MITLTHPLRAAALALAACGVVLAAQAQGRTSMLRVACDGPSMGAEITINGSFKGECPLDVEVEAGTLDVRALKRLDGNREQRFQQRTSIGEGVVKRLDVQLGPPALNETGQRLENERRRLEAERQRAEAERRRVAEEERRRLEEERKQREAAAAARRAELERLADLQQRVRQSERERALRDAFDAAGLRAGTGAPFRDCTDCPEMVWIPPGPAPRTPGDSPIQRWFQGFELAVPLAVGRHEVTFAEWDACVAQGGCSRTPDEGVTEGIIFDSKWGRGRQPVINVSHADAQQFVAWLSRKTGQRYRLLSLIEYQYASRAGSTSIYPWGDRLDAGLANCVGCGGKATDRTLAVGSFPANAWGLFDMVGNVAEHVADCYGSFREGTQRGQLFGNWVRMAERKSVAEPIDQCSAAQGRSAVSDPATGVAGGRFDSPLAGPELHQQFMPRGNFGNSFGFRVAREFQMPEPVFDRAALAPFRDCPDCPELVKLPAGRFEMGTPYRSPEGWLDNEFPLRWVEVGEFAIGRFELTRGQFAAFVRESGHQPAAGCLVVNAGGNDTTLQIDASRGWADPGYVQGDDHPVTCLTRNDATAYLAWLSRRTGQRYRLPSEAEWEYAARGRSENRRPWVRDQARACEFANLRDARFQLAFRTSGNACDDGHAHTAPVGRYQPNAWGLHDMIGNVSEMVEDCWRPDHNGAAADAAPFRREGCTQHVQRGGHWRLNVTTALLSVSGRSSVDPNMASATLGLRVVRETVAPPPGAAPAPSPASSPAPAAAAPAAASAGPAASAAAPRAVVSGGLPTLTPLAPLAPTAVTAPASAAGGR